MNNVFEVNVFIEQDNDNGYSILTIFTNQVNNQMLYIEPIITIDDLALAILFAKSIEFAYHLGGYKVFYGSTNSEIKFHMDSISDNIPFKVKEKEKK